MLRLHGCGLDDVIGGASRWNFMVPCLPEQAAGPEGTDGQQDDQDAQESETKSARMLGKPVVELGGRAQEPGREPEGQQQCCHRQVDRRWSRSHCCPLSVVRCQLFVIGGGLFGALTENCDRILADLHQRAS